jgi:hypothetical protein
LLPNDSISIAHFKFRVYLGPDEVSVAAESPQVHDQTQALNARDLADLNGRPVPARPKPETPPGEPVNRNQLPDVYPDDERKAR